MYENMTKSDEDDHQQQPDTSNPFFLTHIKNRASQKCPHLHVVKEKPVTLGPYEIWDLKCFPRTLSISFCSLLLRHCFSDYQIPLTQLRGVREIRRCTKRLLPRLHTLFS